MYAKTPIPGLEKGGTNMDWIWAGVWTLGAALFVFSVVDSRAGRHSDGLDEGRRPPFTWNCREANPRRGLHWIHPPVEDTEQDHLLWRAQRNR